MPSPTAPRAFVRSLANFASVRVSGPTRTPVYPTQWRVMFGKVVRSTALFIPGYFVLLGWPLFPPFMFNGHMYGLGREPWTKV